MIVFKMIDPDGDGFITMEKLRKANEELSLELSEEDMELMIKEADPTGTGRVDLTEVQTMFVEGKVAMEEQQKFRENIKDAFEWFDTGTKGYLHVNDFPMALRLANINPTPKDVRRMLRKLGYPKRITFPEFRRLTIQANKIESKRIVAAFQCFDPYNSGYIRTGKLRQILEPAICSDFKKKDLEQLIADFDDKGLIKLEVFVAHLTGQENYLAGATLPDLKKTALNLDTPLSSTAPTSSLRTTTRTGLDSQDAGSSIGHTVNVQDAGHMNSDTTTANQPSPAVTKPHTLKSQTVKSVIPETSNLPPNKSKTKVASTINELSSLQSSRASVRKSSADSGEILEPAKSAHSHNSLISPKHSAFYRNDRKSSSFDTKQKSERPSREIPEPVKSAKSNYSLNFSIHSPDETCSSFDTKLKQENPSNTSLVLQQTDLSSKSPLLWEDQEIEVSSTPTVEIKHSSTLKNRPQTDEGNQTRRQSTKSSTKFLCDRNSVRDVSRSNLNPQTTLKSKPGSKTSHRQSPPNSSLPTIKQNPKQTASQMQSQKIIPTVSKKRTSRSNISLQESEIAPSSIHTKTDNNWNEAMAKEKDIEVVKSVLDTNDENINNSNSFCAKSSVKTMPTNIQTQNKTDLSINSRQSLDSALNGSEMSVESNKSSRNLKSAASWKRPKKTYLGMHYARSSSEPLSFRASESIDMSETVISLPDKQSNAPFLPKIPPKLKSKRHYVYKKETLSIMSQPVSSASKRRK